MDGSPLRDASHADSFPAYAGRVARRLDDRRLAEHIDRLYRAAWALCGSREDAEDLVQETFARVLARPRFLRGDDELGYLLRVLRNTFVSSLRSRARRPSADGAIDEERVADRSGARSPQHRAEAHLVFEAIAALPAEFRDVLVAVDVVGLSYAEAARLLKTKEATVTSRLHRARARVIDHVEPAARDVPGKSRARGSV